MIQQNLQQGITKIQTLRDKNCNFGIANYYFTDTTLKGAL